MMAYLGALCKRGHKHEGMNRSLRLSSNNECIVCKNKFNKAFRKTEEGKFYSRRNVHKQRYRDYGDNSNGEVYTLKQWKEILSLFDNKCAYCGGNNDEIDHIIPLARGGDNSHGNILPVCAKCNSSKIDALLDVWYPKQIFFSEERMERIDNHMIDAFGL